MDDDQFTTELGLTVNGPVKMDGIAAEETFSTYGNTPVLLSGRASYMQLRQYFSKGNVEFIPQLVGKKLLS